MEAGSRLEQTLLFAVTLIFLILAAQFESFRDPLIIMVSVPLSLGALLAIHLIDGTLNLYTQIGLVTLVGLITKHGILIVDFANQIQKQEGKSPREAVTSATTLRLMSHPDDHSGYALGAIPLALASGIGAQARIQLGWVILGGYEYRHTVYLVYFTPCLHRISLYSSQQPVTLR